MTSLAQHGGTRIQDALALAGSLLSCLVTRHTLTLADFFRPEISPSLCLTACRFLLLFPGLSISDVISPVATVCRQ